MIAGHADSRALCDGPAFVTLDNCGKYWTRFVRLLMSFRSAFRGHCAPWLHVLRLSHSEPTKPFRLTTDMHFRSRSGCQNDQRYTRPSYPGIECPKILEHPCPQQQVACKRAFSALVGPRCGQSDYPLRMLSTAWDNDPNIFEPSYPLASRYYHFIIVIMTNDLSVHIARL